MCSRYLSLSRFLRTLPFMSDFQKSCRAFDHMRNTKTLGDMCRTNEFARLCFVYAQDLLYHEL